MRLGLTSSWMHLPDPATAVVCRVLEGGPMHEGRVLHDRPLAPCPRTRLRHGGVMSCLPLRSCISDPPPRRLDAFDSRRSVLRAWWNDRRVGPASTHSTRPEERPRIPPGHACTQDITCKTRVVLLVQHTYTHKAVALDVHVASVAGASLFCRAPRACAGASPYCRAPRALTTRGGRRGGGGSKLKQREPARRGRQRTPLPSSAA